MTATFTVTRDQLVDAIAGLRAGPVKSVGGVVKICAEDMADAIIAALAPQAPAAAAGAGDATCDAEPPGAPSAPGGYPWMCTAIPGHAGDHAERDENGRVLAEWPQVQPEGRSS